MRARSRFEGTLRTGHRVTVWLSALATVTLSATFAVTAAAPARPAPPVRQPHAAQDAAGFVHQIQWTSSAPAPGLTLLSGTYQAPSTGAYGEPSAGPDWTVTLQAPISSPFGGPSEEAEVGSAAWAQQTEAQLTTDGFIPTATVIDWPRYSDDPRGAMGVRVRTGAYDTQALATAEATTLSQDGFAPLVEWTGFDPVSEPDAELLHVAIVDPERFSGQAMAYHGTAIASRVTAPASSAALGSLVATNGGYFTIDAPLSAVAGVNTGLSVEGGQIESLANGDRADIVFDGHHRARIENLTSQATLSSSSSSIQILGVNRLPGSAEDCGVSGFSPTGAPRQNTLCTGPNDLVWFTPQFGAPLPSVSGSGPALQAVLNAQDQVISVGQPGGTLPSGDSAVQAVGTDVTWLSSNAQVGQPLAVSEQLQTPSGRPFALDPQMSIASAGPVLLHDRRTAIDAVDEGVLDPRDLNDYTFSADRHARTFVGVRADGDLLLATADAIPGISAGLSLTEEADVMRSLGAVDAMNLDGGGSTQFAVQGQLVNDASSSPLRPVGDTIEIVP